MDNQTQNVQAIRFHERPIMVGVRYEDIIKEPVSVPQEAEARFQVNGKEEIAFVPLYAVNEDDCRAFGAIVGGDDNEVIVEFPPTTLGQSRFTALRADFDKIAIYRQDGT
jgi:hypothetical protein